MMNKWETRGYNRIGSASLNGDKLIIRFENGDLAEIEAERVLPNGVPPGEWRDIHFDSNMIRATVGSLPVEVPWFAIRLLTDSQFSLHAAKKADEQARNVGTRIRELRESKGLTGKELAKRAGISAQSLSRIENAKHDVVFTTLQRILGGMGCSLRDLAEKERLPAGIEKPTKQRIWTPHEPPAGIFRAEPEEQTETSAATTRRGPVTVFNQTGNTTPSNTPSSNTPGIRKVRAA
jgi:transcriptional regulator with XRE-family HTH domain